MAASIDLSGKRFNRLVVIGRTSNKGAKVRWLCQCDCGNTSVAITSDLKSGKHRSCGCWFFDKMNKHGLSRSGTYRSWVSMKQRCTNPKAPHYHRYGGRGIKVCDAWLADFQNFVADMGERPNRHTLERIDNDGNYCKENCRWATRKEQAQNRHYTPPKVQRPRNAKGQYY